jgi:hypothetical protein
MSNQLAISAAFSVLMMASYALLGPDAVRAPIGPGSFRAQISVIAPLPPSAAQFIPSIR